MGTDRAYYERRLREEQARARTAFSIEERHFHRSLAALYAQRLDGAAPEAIGPGQ